MYPYKTYKKGDSKRAYGTVRKSDCALLGSIAILPDEIHMLLRVSTSFGQLILWALSYQQKHIMSICFLYILGKIKAVRNAHGLYVNMVLAEGFEPPIPSM